MSKHHEFLQLGYISRDVDTHIKLEYEYQNELNEYGLEELLEMGYQLLMKEIENIISGKNIVVPISGGLDSRLILSAVAECTNVDSIKTYTFGSPKALDYEIGNQIGRKLNTQHRSINLLEHEYKIEDLYQFANNINNPAVMFHNIPRTEFLEDENLIISGFLGDVVSGKRLGFIEGEEHEVKYNYFKSMVARNNFSVDNAVLLDELVQKTSYNDLPNLSDIEKYYILEHNFKLNLEQVFGNIKNENMHAPFVNTEFMNFLLSLPKEYRKNQYFYKKIIFEKMSGLLKELPVRNFYGTKYNTGQTKRNFYRSKNKIRHIMSDRIDKIHSPHVNYVDFYKKIKLDKSFKNLILKLLYSLNEREMGAYSIEIDKAIYEIENNKVKHPYDYLLLCSLEIYIRNGNININE